jgi:hypothetical protein
MPCANPAYGVFFKTVLDTTNLVKNQSDRRYTIHFYLWNIAFGKYFYGL